MPVSSMASASGGIREIFSQHPYRAVLLDQFGVLHDGSTPYPSASGALGALRDAGVEVVVLSNSSRRSNHASSKLHSMFPAVPPLDVITSGELAREMLHSSDASLNPLAGARKIFHTNWVGRGSISARDNNILSLTTEIAEADAVVLHGTEGVSIPSDDSTNPGNEQVKPVSWEGLLESVRYFAKALPDAPFVVVNPDIVTVDGSSLRNMPGKLGLAYEAAGGRGILRVGKPGAHAYAAALARLSAKGIRKEECCAVGDSVAHDVLGAQHAGIDSIFVAGGIDGAKFGLDSSAVGRDRTETTSVGKFRMSWNVWDEIVAEAAPECARPTHVVDYFRW